MKQLLIIRHAKSSWELGVLNDFDRGLNDRGHKDAPEMAKRLIAKNIPINLFVSSTAKRALTTAIYFAETYNNKKEEIVQVPELYHATPNIFYEAIIKLDNNYQTVAIFSHNPGITEFVNQLTKTQIDDMPTCGVFAIQIHTSSWANFKSAKKDFLFFYYPKSI